LLVRTGDVGALERWPIESWDGQSRELVLDKNGERRYSLEDAVRIVCKMQRETETEEERERRLAPVDRWGWEE
jgi:hypothetical protein